MDTIHVKTPDFADLSAFALTVATAGNSEDVFRATEIATKRLIGHSLFTVMSFDLDAMEVERCYTSDPANYPCGGRKKKRDTAWGQHVLVNGHVNIGSTVEDLRHSFDDHEVITGLGLCSVLNVPIKRMGRVIGTMNLLDTTPHYNEDDALVGAVIAMGLAAILP